MDFALIAIGLVAVVAVVLRFVPAGEPDRRRDWHGPQQDRIDRARRLTQDYRDHRLVGSVPRWDP